MTLKRFTPVALLAVSALIAIPAAAQTNGAAAAQAPESGVSSYTSRIDFGVRVGTVDGDPARWQRYRDRRDGIVFDMLRVSRTKGDWLFDASADHVGYRDQRFSAEALKPGKFRASFLWDQIPLFMSQDTKTLYTADGGRLLVDDAVQSGIQGGTLTLRDAAGRATNVLTRTRRDIAAGTIGYRLTPGTDWSLKVNTQRREGAIPFGGSFGFNNAVEIPLPLDQRTTNVGTGLEWGNQRSMARVNWDGSWYNNNLPVVTWDSPIRLSDSTTAPSQGRMPLWPSNRFHALSGAASAKLPGRSRLTGSVSVGWSTQNEELVPNTINTALTAASLPRTTAETRGRTASTYLSFTSRPVRALFLSARHRYYEFDNQSEHFLRSGTVSYDTTARPGDSEAVFYSTARQTFDVDATATRGRASFTAGYGLQAGDRTGRHFEETLERTFRTSMDVLGSGPFSLRGQFEHAVREGSGFDVQALEHASESPAIRHYDIADRTRDRTSIIASFAPVEQIDFQVSIAAGRDDYTGNGELGLRDNTHRVYTAGASFAANETASLGLSYSFENYEALLAQRNATTTAQWTDPTRRWDAENADRAHTVTADLELRELFDKTDVRVGFDYARARTTFTYTLFENSAIAAPTPLPAVRHVERRAELGVTRRLRDRVALGFDYWFDRYDVEDFALGGDIDQSIAFSETGTVSTVLLNYLYRPYRGHTGILRVSYFF